MNMFLYIIDNFGFLLILSVIGYLNGLKRQRILLFPFFCIFILAFIFRFTWYGNIDQKLVFFGGLFFVLWAAKGFIILLKRSFVIKIVALVLLVLSTISGFIDIMVIKNDFMYPVQDMGSLTVMQWINNYTKSDDVFLSYADIFDPVILTGRKNYWGFYKNFGTPDRDSIAKNIYAGDMGTAQKLGISYILAPKWDKSDFPYVVDTMYFKEHNMTVYEDEKYSIFTTRRN